MITIEFITALFYEVDEQLGAIPKHPKAHLWPSEVVTLGLLHALNARASFVSSGPIRAGPRSSWPPQRCSASLTPTASS
jgi:hypothetical protein